MQPSLVAALLGAVFAVVVAGRWRQSRRPALLAWTVGLLVFGAAAAAQAVGERRGFDPTTFRLFYLLGGILGVAYLGLGTVHLAATRRLAEVATWALLAATALSIVAVALVGVDRGRLGDTAGVLGDAMTGAWAVPCRVLAGVLNALGTLVLVGGSAESAWRLWRRGGAPDRVLCNVLLTAGALVVAAGLSQARLRGDAAGGIDVLGLYEAVGIGVMFAGFLCLGRVGVRAGG